MTGEMFTLQWPDDTCVINRMQEEVDSVLGRGTWETLTRSHPLDADMDGLQKSSSTYHILQGIDNQTDEEKRNKIFSNIRHGLTKKHFTWARERFLAYNDIDLFAEAVMQESLEIIKGFLHGK